MKDNVKIGACRFCGQTQQLDPECEATEEKLYWLATMQCSCEDALHFQNLNGVAEEIDESWGGRHAGSCNISKAGSSLY